MKKLSPAIRKRVPRALNAETVASAGDMTGLMPFLPETMDEEAAYRQMYPVHKARRH